MGDFTAVAVYKDPFRENICLWVMLFDLYAGLQEVVEERIKFI